MENQELRQSLTQATDGTLEIMSKANLLGAALSHWAEQHGDLSGASDLAYEIRGQALAIEESLSRVRGLLNQ